MLLNNDVYALLKCKNFPEKYSNEFFNNLNTRPNQSGAPHQPLKLLSLVILRYPNNIQ